MSKISFLNDYSVLAHPQILEALHQANGTHEKTYGNDVHSAQVQEMLRSMTKTNCDVHLISGGTQTNLTALAHCLRPYEGVIACPSGHINTHESGAIEATGHTIKPTNDTNGKISLSELAQVHATHRGEHMIKPKLVYLSQATETGLLYSKKELEDISTFCKEHDLYLFMDGARLGSALASTQNDLGLEDIARLTDMFYFGGTKSGLLCGEALVITNDELKDNFRNSLKQRGAMLAKGAFLGVQFKTLFENDLYLKINQNSNTMAARLSDIFNKAGYNLANPCQTNQVFAQIPLDLKNKLEEKFVFLTWEEDAKTSTVRFVTSWATTDSEVDAFANALS